MIRTLDITDFIEQKKENVPPANTVYVVETSALSNNSSMRADAAACYHELFGIKGMLIQKEKGAIIYHEGSDADSFYLLKKGAIALKRKDTNGNMAIQEIKPFEFLGVESLFSEKRMTSAIVDSDAELYEFKKSDALNSITFKDNKTLLKIFEEFKNRIEEGLRKREKDVKPVNNKLGNVESLNKGGASEKNRATRETKNVPRPKEDEKQSLLNEHEIRLLLSHSAIFASIGLNEMDKIVKNSVLISYKKDSEIIKTATRGENRFYIIKKGQVKGIRVSSRGNPVTTYYEEGDFFGEMPFVYNVENTETIISLTDVELLALDKDAFKDLYENHSGFKKAIINRIKEKAKEQSEIENNLKAAGITNFMIENGLTYATRLKVYEANKCISCLSCVKACKSRHGTARFKRVNIRYSFVNVPQSCRTCKYPTCLSKCRKDAIKREKDGEIVINSNCVGCGLCAKSCSFGAIEVIELDTDSKDAKPKRSAIKCDHCREYDNCACVAECPTGAIKHVNPETYFKTISG
ncbi:MAG: cyclic nucleotide-binding domain-containing protein [Nitrospirae bacterium]|nr:cyclic nucleotide-binding domain-containing protein [Nitrospirota bacterium]